MQKIKIAIIGAGLAWEKLHEPAYQALTEQYEIKAVCDTDANRAESVRAKYNLSENSVYSNYMELLKTADIDAVDLMLPITENYEAAKAVITAKLHLIAEKPFASSPEAAKELIALAKKKNVKVLVAENYRYDEANTIIKDIITSGKIGDIIYFLYNDISNFPEEAQSDSFSSVGWRKHPDFKGGTLLDSGVHRIAKMRYFFGDAKEIYAKGRPSDVDYAPHSAVNATLVFDKDVVGHYSMFNMGKETQAPLVGLRIFGTNGEIYLEDPDCGFVNVSYKNGGHEVIPYKTGSGYYHELANFYDALVNNADIVSTPEKELGDIQAVYDILDSIEKGKCIKATIV